MFRSDLYKEKSKTYTKPKPSEILRIELKGKRKSLNQEKLRKFCLPSTKRLKFLKKNYSQSLRDLYQNVPIECKERILANGSTSTHRQRQRQRSIHEEDQETPTKLMKHASKHVKSKTMSNFQFSKSTGVWTIPRKIEEQIKKCTVSPANTKGGMIIQDSPVEIREYREVYSSPTDLQESFELTIRRNFPAQEYEKYYPTSHKEKKVEEEGERECECEAKDNEENQEIEKNRKFIVYSTFLDELKYFRTSLNDMKKEIEQSSKFLDLFKLVEKFVSNNKL